MGRGKDRVPVAASENVSEKDQNCPNDNGKSTLPDDPSVTASPSVSHL